MALAVTTPPGRSSWISGGKKVRSRILTGDAAYPTGGWPLTKVQIGLGASDTVDAVIVTSDAGYFPVYDIANQKLKVYTAAATEAAANLAGLNTSVFRLLAFGN